MSGGMLITNNECRDCYGTGQRVGHGEQCWNCAGTGREFTALGREMLLLLKKHFKLEPVKDE